MSVVRSVDKQNNLQCTQTCLAFSRYLPVCNVTCDHVFLNFYGVYALLSVDFVRSLPYLRSPLEQIDSSCSYLSLYNLKSIGVELKQGRRDVLIGLDLLFI